MLYVRGKLCEYTYVYDMKNHTHTHICIYISFKECTTYQNVSWRFLPVEKLCYARAVYNYTFSFSELVSLNSV